MAQGSENRERIKRRERSKRVIERTRETEREKDWINPRTSDTGYVGARAEEMVKEFLLSFFFIIIKVIKVNILVKLQLHIIISHVVGTPLHP